MQSLRPQDFEAKYGTHRVYGADYKVQRRRNILFCMLLLPLVRWVGSWRQDWKSRWCSSGSSHARNNRRKRWGRCSVSPFAGNREWDNGWHDTLLLRVWLKAGWWTNIQLRNNSCSISALSRSREWD